MSVASTCLRRLSRELSLIQAEGISPTVHVAAHSSDLRTIDALIIGPPDTPYDGGMIHFRLKVPSEYPLRPPQVTCLSTDGGTLRVHPQLYADGKVCLSILGTWHGPKWSAGMSLRTLLLSIQSLLSEDPLRCEPGFEQADQDDVDRANVYVVHEVVRVLVLGNLTKEPTWGASEDFAPFTAVMHEHLRERRASLLEKLGELAQKHDGQVMRDPFANSLLSAGRRYQFASLRQKLLESLSGTGPARLQGVAHAVGQETVDATSKNDGFEDAPYCRICHMTEEESGLSLVVPCRCRGSIGHAHSKCVLEWLQRSSQTRWQCDICQSEYRVRLGRGRPLGHLYLRRDLDVFANWDFDAPGPVAVLLTSLITIVLTTFVRVLAGTWIRIAAGVCELFPAIIGGPLLCVLGLPSVLLELLTFSIYLVFLVCKAAVSWYGADWRPVIWGSFGEECVGLVLNTVADSLGFAVGLRLDGLMVLCFYFSTSQLWYLVSGRSVLLSFLCSVPGGSVLLWPKVANLEGPLTDSFGVLSNVLPLSAASGLDRTHRLLAVVSLGLNFLALGRLLRRAFWDAKLVPVDVLPADGSAPGPASGPAQRGGTASRNTREEVT